MSDSLRPHGLYSSWNSLGQNIEVGSRSLFQGGLPNPGIEPRSPALQVDSLSAEPPGKPQKTRGCVCSSPDTAVSSMTQCNLVRGGPVITYSSTQACPGIDPPERTQKGGKAEHLKVNSDHPIANLRRAVNSTWWKITSEPHITCELHISLYCLWLQKWLFFLSEKGSTLNHTLWGQLCTKTSIPVAG